MGWILPPPGGGLVGRRGRKKDGKGSIEKGTFGKRSIDAAADSGSKAKGDNFSIAFARPSGPSLTLGLNHAGDRVVLFYARPAKKTASGKLTAFTRLAGMFMGNVAAVSVGNFDLCFNLELRRAT